MSITTIEKIGMPYHALCYKVSKERKRDKYVTMQRIRKIDGYNVEIKDVCTEVGFSDLCLNCEKKEPLLKA
ncbi:MAG: hypothetical protein ACE5J4_00085 [Candidatus Aenigmatarchaeota archaeon]